MFQISLSLIKYSYGELTDFLNLTQQMEKTLRQKS